MVSHTLRVWKKTHTTPLSTHTCPALPPHTPLLYLPHTRPAPPCPPPPPTPPRYLKEEVSNDPEMAEMCREEMAELQAALSQMEASLKVFLLPKVGR